VDDNAAALDAVLRIVKVARGIEHLPERRVS